PCPPRRASSGAAGGDGLVPLSGTEPAGLELNLGSPQPAVDRGSRSRRNSAPGEHGFRRSPTEEWRRTAGENVRIVVGLAGSSAPIYGIRTLQALQEAGIETHLVVSDGAKRTIPLETHWTMEKIESLATVVYPNHELAASISSGSFQTDGMIIAPCSMKT